jgi:hypothetical protein
MRKFNIEETVKRFQFLSEYDTGKPTNYYDELKEYTKRVNRPLNHKMLSEMRGGYINEHRAILDLHPNINSILKIDEAYQNFSTFISSLKTDTASLQNPENSVRKVFNNFMNGTPQKWLLINPQEYHAALKHVMNSTAHRLGDDHWARKVSEWEDMVKHNIRQLAANSFLTSGPELNQGRINSNGENSHYLLWRNLSGDENIPVKREEITFEKAALFNDTYLDPFIDYIGTNQDHDGEAYETDSLLSLNRLFDIVAEFDKNRMDANKNIITLNRLIDIVHGRGSLSYLFVKGGVESLDDIAGFKKGVYENE